MGTFTIGRAWRLGLDFIKRAPAGHALLLIGVATLLPALIQWWLVGGTPSMTNPAALQRAGAAILRGGGLAAVAASVFGYLLTTGGYFGSWRLGLDREVSVGGAVNYGLAAGLAIVGIAFAVGIVSFAIAQAVGPLWGLLAVLIAFPLLIGFYNVMGAMIGVAMVLMGLLVLVFGAAGNGINPGIGNFRVSGGGVGSAVLVPLGLLFLWLAARLSCVAPAMASRASLNFVEASGISWRLTGRAQVRIMVWLALVGFVFGLIYMIFAVVMAASLRASFESGGLAAIGSVGIGAILFAMLMGVVSAYLSALVPAGIYRALQPDVDASAAVFE